MKNRTLLRFAVIAAIVAFIFTSCSKKDSIVNSQTASQNVTNHPGTNDPTPLPNAGTIQAEFTQYVNFPISIVASDGSGFTSKEIFVDPNTGSAQVDVPAGTYTVTAHAYTDQWSQDYNDVIIANITVAVGQVVDLGTITFQ